MYLSLNVTREDTRGIQFHGLLMQLSSALQYQGRTGPVLITTPKPRPRLGTRMLKFGQIQPNEADLSPQLSVLGIQVGSGDKWMEG